MPAAVLAAAAADAAAYADSQTWCCTHTAAFPQQKTAIGHSW